MQGAGRMRSFPFPFLLLLFSLSLFSAPHSACAAPRAPDDSFVSGEILVKFNPDSGARELEHVLALLDARVIEKYEIVPGLHRIQLVSPGSSVAGALERLSREADGAAIEYAEPNYLIQLPEGENLDSSRAAILPQAPPLAAPQAQPAGWIPDPQMAANYGVNQNGTTLVWSRLGWIGSPRTVIAVLDSGIDYLHPDLEANLWRNLREEQGLPGVDDDGNGYIDDRIGWNVVGRDALPYDDLGHGTHVSGIAAAVGGNGIGIAGQCPRCSLMPLKMIDASGMGNDGWAIGALEYAYRMGASVINCSWGQSQASRALYDAFLAMSRAGVFTAVAAGNAGANLDYVNSYPAKFPVPGLFSVAALDFSALITRWSNFGPRSVPLSSAGDRVLSTVPGGGWSLGSGTSMASPNLAGSVALIRSYRPGLTLPELARLLTRVVPDPSSARKTAFGGRPDLPAIFSGILGARILEP